MNWLFGTIKVVPKHLVGIGICNFGGTVVSVVVVCRLFETRRDRRLWRIYVQEDHIRITLFHRVWILVALGLIILPIISRYSYTWTSSHFHRSRKCVVVDMIHIRLDASYSSRFARHIHTFVKKSIFLQTSGFPKRGRFHSFCYTLDIETNKNKTRTNQAFWEGNWYTPLKI